MWYVSPILIGSVFFGKKSNGLNTMKIISKPNGIKYDAIYETPNNNNLFVHLVHTANIQHSIV